MRKLFRGFIVFITVLLIVITSSCGLINVFDAINKGDVTAVKTYIKFGGNVNVVNKQYRNSTPLIWAVVSNQLEITKLLVNAKADINSEDLLGMTPLMWAAFNGETEAVKLLIDNKANINQRNGRRAGTAIMYAASSGDADALTMLIKAGADINLIDVTGFSPLTRAIQNGKTNTAELLRKAGAK